MPDVHFRKPCGPPSIEAEPLTSQQLADIVARALWNPAHVSATEVQVLAASLRSLMAGAAQAVPPEAEWISA